MVGAREFPVGAAPALHATVSRLATLAGVPKPRVYLLADGHPRALSAGRGPRGTAIAVSQGLLAAAPPAELEGVLAHELAHIKNHDMLLQTFTATLAGAISNLAQFGLFFGGRDDEDSSPVAGIAMAILAPIAAMLIQFAISRQREFKADAVGAAISGRPRSLANALRKLEVGAHRIPMHVAPAVAPLAQVNPLAAYGGGLMTLFSTHPPTAERVARLEALAA
jgi:heat shock protein HtpX